MSDLERQDTSPEALAEEKKQKSRNRVFGFLVILNIALLGIFVYEIIMLVKG